MVVDNLPNATFNGQDAQLEAAISYLRGMIKEKPVPVPPAPPYPIRTFESSRRLVNGTPMQGAEASGYANQSLRAMIFRRREHHAKACNGLDHAAGSCRRTDSGGQAGYTGEFKTIIQHYWEAWSTLNPTTPRPCTRRKPTRVL